MGLTQRGTDAQPDRAQAPFADIGLHGAAGIVPHLAGGTGLQSTRPLVQHGHLAKLGKSAPNLSEKIHSLSKTAAPNNIIINHSIYNY